MRRATLTTASVLAPVDGKGLIAAWSAHQPTMAKTVKKCAGVETVAHATIFRGRVTAPRDGSDLCVKIRARPEPTGQNAQINAGVRMAEPVSLLEESATALLDGLEKCVQIHVRLAFGVSTAAKCVSAPMEPPATKSPENATACPDLKEKGAWNGAHLDTMGRTAPSAAYVKTMLNAPMLTAIALARTVGLEMIVAYELVKSIFTAVDVAVFVLVMSTIQSRVTLGPEDASARLVSVAPPVPARAHCTHMGRAAGSSASAKMRPSVTMSTVPAPALPVTWATIAANVVLQTVSGRTVNRSACAKTQGIVRTRTDIAYANQGGMASRVTIRVRKDSTARSVTRSARAKTELLAIL